MAARCRCEKDIWYSWSLAPQHSTSADTCSHRLPSFTNHSLQDGERPSLVRDWPTNAKQGQATRTAFNAWLMGRQLRALLPQVSWRTCCRWISHNYFPNSRWFFCSRVMLKCVWQGDVCESMKCGWLQFVLCSSNNNKKSIDSVNPNHQNLCTILKPKRPSARWKHDVDRFPVRVEHSWSMKHRWLSSSCPEYHRPRAAGKCLMMAKHGTRFRQSLRKQSWTLG